MQIQSEPKGGVVLAGRLLFALIFILSGVSHFSRETIALAVSQGVPLASIAVPLFGILALAGALSILFGYQAKIGAWLLVIFLVPVTFAMHKFCLLLQRASVTRSCWPIPGFKPTRESRMLPS